MGMADQFGREIKYLRLSVTDRCDLRCKYCMPELQEFLPRKNVLSLEELYRLALGFIERGISKIRITGGEPLVRKDIGDLIRALGRRLGHGLEELTLTTNGTRLGEFADCLAAAGIRRLNVSLDTLDRSKFAEMTRRDQLDQVLAGIKAAQSAGLAVKINTVALKDFNETEIPGLIEWAHSQSLDISLIEVMPLGEIEAERTDQFVSLGRVHEELSERWTLSKSDHATSGPSKYYDISETGGRIGFITPLSDNFCAGCNRIRVTATGQLYPCLGGKERVDLRAALRSANSDVALCDALQQAMRMKPLKHDFLEQFTDGSRRLQRHMSMTGG